MSWTQGIQLRENCTEKQIANLDKIGYDRFGEDYKFVAFVWDLNDPDTIYLDYQAANGDYRSLRYNNAGMA